MRLVLMILFAMSVLLPLPQTWGQNALGPADDQEVTRFLSPYDLNRVLPGDMAPDFSLQDENGRVHQLSDYRGKNVVLVMYRGWW